MDKVVEESFNPVLEGVTTTAGKLARLAFSGTKEHSEDPKPGQLIKEVRINSEAVKLPKTGLRLASLKEAFSSLWYPVRFVVTENGANDYFCELDCMSDIADYCLPKSHIIMDWQVVKFLTRFCTLWREVNSRLVKIQNRLAWL